ncbi:MAG TPA: helix-turn-helix transcriptional regulator [Pirellulaceae bacterium]|jgi:transcriptional regulator with XRE-family HTH domain
MSDQIERTYLADAKNIIRLMKEQGFSLDSLAAAAPAISVVTLKRLLQQERKGLMATFKKIAAKLGVAPGRLILDPTADEQPGQATYDYKRIQPALDLAKEFSEFDETTELPDIVASIHKIIGAKAVIYVIAVVPGDSVIAHISVTIEDFDGLIRHFLQGDLKHLAIKSILVPANNAIVVATLSKYAPHVAPAANDNMLRISEKAG